ncbi:MAG: hypothetical protein LBP29_04500 [Treponema sp.]|jgi:hypothetical protein|nr:hypothetical protein [Treponema sp.]
MKKSFFVMLLAAAAVSLFAQAQLPEYHFASGSWSFSGERLYQNDARARLAKINIRIPQNGPMLYEFDARYESGAEDGHGGFGLHIFADSALNRASWGAGKSYLLWLNYDERPVNRDIPRGLSAQVYRSYTNSRMELIQSVDLNHYAGLLTEENLAYPVHFKILVDGNTGEIQVYDPTAEDTYYVLNVDLPSRGNWIALRTNGLKASFTR